MSRVRAASLREKAGVSPIMCWSSFQSHGTDMHRRSATQRRLRSQVGMLLWGLFSVSYPSPETISKDMLMIWKVNVCGHFIALRH